MIGSIHKGSRFESIRFGKFSSLIRALRLVFMGAESFEKSQSFVHGTGGMRRRVGSKFKRSGHPHARPKNRRRSPSPARPAWHDAHHAKRPARPTTSMALNLLIEVSNKTSALPIELTQDLMDAFEIISNVFDGSALGQVR